MSEPTPREIFVQDVRAAMVRLEECYRAQDARNRKSKCPLCGNRGFTCEPNNAAATYRPCACKIKPKLEAAINQAASSKAERKLEQIHDAYAVMEWDTGEPDEPTDAECVKIYEGVLNNILNILNESEGE